MKQVSLPLLIGTLLLLNGCATAPLLADVDKPSLLKQWGRSLSEKTIGHKQDIGKGVGAIAGAVIANKMAGDDKQLATFIGGALGSLIGGSIGKQLDERDRELHTHAIQKSLDKDVGETALWHNSESENKGTIKVVNAYKEGDQLCKKVDAVITTKSGETDKQTITGCQDNDGGWTLAG